MNGFLGPKSFQDFWEAGPWSVCFNPGQFVSAQVSLINVGTKHWSQVTGRCFANSESILRPKQKFFGLILAFING